MNTRTEATRRDDPEGVTIDRKIPLWGVLGVIGGLLAQAVVIWNAQNLQTAEIKHQSEQIQDLAAQVKAMAAQLNAKDGIDLKQDLRIESVEQRVTKLEAAKERR